MNTNWEQRVVLVTGGASGIGLAAVKRFVGLGAVVEFCGRRKTLGEEIAADLGDRARFTQVDVETEDEFAAFIAGAHDRHGRIDGLFNNAGGPAAAGSVAAIDSDDVDRAYRLLFRSVFYGVKHAAPLMSRQGSGAIVNNASVAGHLGGYATSHLYAAFKAAIIQFTKSVALELAEDGVRINSVSPGAISTGIFARGAGMGSDDADASADTVKKLLKKAQPLARAGVPDDVAATVEFLISDDAGFITGRDLVVDGGLIAGRRFSDVESGRAAMKAALGAAKD
ncbi:MAG: SDR family oxidoreductase [Pseudomonadota bacterium]